MYLEKLLYFRVTLTIKLGIGPIIYYCALTVKLYSRMYNRQEFIFFTTLKLQPGFLFKD